jgi:hypothetical protein
MTHLLMALLKDRPRRTVEPPATPSLLAGVPGITWIRQYAPATELVDTVVLAGAADESLGPAFNQLHEDWLANLGLYEHRIGGIPGRDFSLSGSVSIFACDVSPEAEEDWNNYYDTEHFPNVVRQERYVGGARFVRRRVAESDFETPHRQKYLALYELQHNLDASSMQSAMNEPGAKREYEAWLEKGHPFVTNRLHFGADPLLPTS